MSCRLLSCQSSQHKHGFPRHVRTLSTRLSCPMPAIDVAHQHLLTARSIHTAQTLAGRAKYG